MAIIIIRTGTFTSEVECPNAIYGEELCYSAKVYRSDVSYCFAVQNTEVWSSDTPDKVGQYTIKATSTTFFGKTKESRADFEITERDLYVDFTDTDLRYDSNDMPNIVYRGLVGQDRVINVPELGISMPEYLGEGRLSGYKNGDLTIVNMNDEDVSYCYNVVSPDTMVTVIKKPITITPADVSAEYDGEEHFATDEIQVISGTPGADKTVAATVEGRAVDIGSWTSRITDYSVHSTSGEDLTEYYEVNTIPGTIVITARNLTVDIKDAEKVYDGRELVPEYGVVSGSLLNGDELKAVHAEQPKNVGEWSVDSAFEVWRNEENVTDLYKITVVPGQCVINPRPITVSSKSASKEYDGTYLSRPGISIDAGSLSEGDRLENLSHCSLIEAGEAPNTVYFAIYNESDTDVTSNYSITKNWGTLTVNKRKLTVQTFDQTIMQGSSDIDYLDYAIIEGSVADGQVCTPNCTYRTNLTPGVYDNQTYLEFFEEDQYGFENDVTKNYDVTQRLGTLTIQPSSNSGSSEDNASDDGADEDGADEDDIVEDEVFVGIGEGTLFVDQQFSKLNNFDSHVSSDFELSSDTNPLFKVSNWYSDDQPLYLKGISKGDYVNGEWMPAVAYDGAMPVTPARRLGALLRQSGATCSYLTILIPNGGSLLPYYAYTYMPDNEDDVALYKTSSISMEVAKADLDDVLSLNPDNCDKMDYYEDLGFHEKEYREFVYEHYLDVDPEIAKVLNELIEDAGINKNSKTIIKDVMYYIRKSAVYNVNFKRYPNDEDPIIYFLTQAKEGICQHYASAATLMYRVLGIPARYTMGYKVNTSSQDWTNVYPQDAHAWTEVYLDGIGWVLVEVTGFNRYALQNNYPARGNLEVRMVDTVKYFNNEPQTSNLFSCIGLSSSDEIICEGTAKATYVGTYKNDFASFVVVDRSGRDVTSEYTVTLIPGELKVMPIKAISQSEFEMTEKLDSIDLSEYSWNVSGYDIMPHFGIDESMPTDNVTAVNENTLYAVSSGTALLTAKYDDIDYNGDGVLEVESDETANTKVIVNTLTHVTLVNDKFDAQRMSGRFTEPAGHDVCIITGCLGDEYNGICVSMRSVEQEYDGEILTADYADLVDGKLYPGDRIVVAADAAIKYTGSVDNICKKIQIFDIEGKEVTGRYLIDVYKGELTINPDKKQKEDMEFSMNLWSSVKTADILAMLPEKEYDWQLELLDEDNRAVMKNGALNALRTGQVTLNAYTTRDINGDDVIEYECSVNIYVTIKIPVLVWILMAGLLAVIAILAYFRHPALIRRRANKD